MDLVMMVNHEDKEIIFNGKPFTVKRGQRITSIRGLAERWHWSVNRTLRYLRLLEELGMIHRDSNAKRTLLTIANYRVYQDMQNTHGDSNEDSGGDSDEHTHGDSDGSQYNNNNNVNNENNINKGKKFSPPSVEEVRSYCQERNNNVDPESFVDYYASQKWKKANGRPVEDWKACVRTWEKKEFKDKPKNKFINFNQRQYDMTELEKALNRR